LARVRLEVLDSVQALAALSGMEAATAPAMGLGTREPALKTAPVLELPNNINFV
jgi:hypothetical protein